MRKNWKKYQLKDILENLYDGPHATPKPSNEGPIFLGIKNLTDDGKFDLNEIRHIAKDDFPNWTKRVLPSKNDIVFTYEATLHRYGLIPESMVCCLGRRMGLLRLKENKVNPHFLLLYFQSPEWKQIIERNIIVGATVNRIPISEMPDFPLFLPDITEQNQIASVLSPLYAKIEINNKINQELEVMAKTLYDYWFVQFDFPNEQGKPYKSSGGKMVYNEELKREIPDGWEVKTISEWIKNDKSGDWGKEAEVGNYTVKVSCVRGADLNGLNGKGELNSPTRFILQNNENKILINHDIIIEISGGSPTQSTGRLAFITEETLNRFPNPLICSNFCKALTLRKEKFLYNFVYQWNRLYDNGVLFGWEGKTSGIKNLLFESFVTNQKEVYPKSDVVAKFYEIVKPIHAKKQMNLLENQKLTELRDWLLPMLMNGQVTVGEISERRDMAAEPKIDYYTKS